MLWNCDPKKYTLTLITHFHVHGPWSHDPRKHFLQTLISLSHLSLLLSHKYWSRDSRRHSVNHFFYFALKPLSSVSHLSPSCMLAMKLLSKKVPYANPLFFLTVKAPLARKQFFSLSEPTLSFLSKTPILEKSKVKTSLQQKKKKRR